jgi:hypothetical protein
MPRNLFSSNPIPAKAKKLGLLSIYKFALVGPTEIQVLGLARCKCSWLKFIKGTANFPFYSVGDKFSEEYPHQEKSTR